MKPRDIETGRTQGKTVIMPMISVLVANRNHAEYIGECLRSILDQSIENLEAVVYDDASTDGSAALVEDIRRSEPQRVRLLTGKRRRGPGYARNQAARAARGQFLTTLDADDYFVGKDKLKREMELLDGIAATEGIQAAVFSDVLETSPDGNERRWSDFLTVHEGWIQTRLITRDGFIPRDFLFPRTAFFACGGYDSRLKTHEDWDLKIRLAAILPFYFTGVPGVVYRRLDNGLSRTCRHRRICNLWRVYGRHRHCLEPGRRSSADREFAKKISGLEAPDPGLPALLRRWVCGRLGIVMPRRRHFDGGQSGI
ncbi:MAG: glycosyltransferase [Acidobacteriota bacterium]|jgi:glycosyltransferase involved in cell wall biosynthesis|nr:glycosyltransferase [Acidobacteriota bacterium]